MHTVSQMNAKLHAQAHRKQAELWDAIIETVAGAWERGWSRSWSVDARVTVDEIMGDLQHGRE